MIITELKLTETFSTKSPIIQRVYLALNYQREKNGPPDEGIKLVI